MIQGVAEFLPISSSGHLVLSQNILGLSEPNIAFDIILHVGTLFAVLIYLWNFLMHIVHDSLSFASRKIRFRESYFKIGLFAIIGCIPAFIVVLFFKDIFVSFFSSAFKTSLLLILNGFVLLLSRYLKPKTDVISIQSMKWWHALIIGMAQACAIFPGISRSGMTITSSLVLGLDPFLAFQFSFLLAIPAILGAVLFELGALMDMGSATFLYSIGLLVSFIFGYISLCVLKRFVIQKKIHCFSFLLFFYRCCKRGLFLLFLKVIFL